MANTGKKHCHCEHASMLMSALNTAVYSLTEWLAWLWTLNLVIYVLKPAALTQLTVCFSTTEIHRCDEPANNLQ